MARFYKILWSHEGKSKGKLKALCKAQLWLIREGAAELGRMRGGLSEPVPSRADRCRRHGPWAALVLLG